jgi:type I restriction enzyme S subunit
MKWCQTTLKEICISSAFGPRFSSDLYAVDGNIATLRTTDLSADGNINYLTMPLANVTSNSFISHFLQSGDLVVSRSGTIGIVALFIGFHLPVLPGAFLIRFRLDTSKSESLFYKYYFHSPVGKGKILATATGAVQQNLNLTNLNTIEIPIPPLTTQRRIASILSAYDDLIENNLKRIKLLEEKAQLHYKDLIQDSAKWDNVKLDEFVSVVKGRKPSNVFEQPEEDSQLYLLLDTVERGKTLYTSDLTLPQSKITDVLMCMDGARSGLSFRGMVGAIGSTMAIWRSNSERVSGEFLYQFMKQNESAIAQGNTGAAIPHANRKFILDMKIAMPPKKEAVYFDGLTLPMIKLINTLHNQNAKLREARDILLPKLMNGQIEL